MLKRLIILTSLLLFSTLSLADTCPASRDIKHHQLSSWKIYDSDEDTLLSAQRQAEFLTKVDHFALAEWSRENKQSGHVRCYYKDKNGSTLEAYLARKDYVDIAKNNQKFWYPVSGLMECAAERNNCQFESHQQLDVESGLAEK